MVQSASRPATKVIVNIDDVGMLKSINDAALTLLAETEIASVSLMATGPWLPDFVARVQAIPKHVSMGLHLCLTSEWAPIRVSALSGIGLRSIHDSDGYLPADQAGLHQADSREVQIELRAQLDRVRRLGVNVSHIDCHMLFYEVSHSMLECVLDLCVTEGLPVLLYSDDARRQARFRGVRCPTAGSIDNYFFPEDGLEQRYVQHLTGFSAARAPIVAIHPGKASDELYDALGVDASRRVNEFEIFRRREFWDRLGIAPVGALAL